MKNVVLSVLVAEWRGAEFRRVRGLHGDAALALDARATLGDANVPVLAPSRAPGVLDLQA